MAAMAALAPIGSVEDLAAPDVSMTTRGQDDNLGTQLSILDRTILAREGSKQDEVSSKGAIGRHQVLPSTAVPYLFPGANASDPAVLAQAKQLLFNDAVNTRVGQAYIKDLWNQFHDPQAVMVAYNAGPGVATRWIEKNKDPSVLPGETRQYIGIGASAKPGAPSWFPAPEAIESEQRRSNTSVVNMSPEEY